MVKNVNHKNVESKQKRIYNQQETLFVYLVLSRINISF
jgi:hypothetical protein